MADYCEPDHTASQFVISNSFQHQSDNNLLIIVSGCEGIFNMVLS